MTFLDKSDRDILDQMVGDAGLTLEWKSRKGDHVQARVSAQPDRSRVPAHPGGAHGLSRLVRRTRSSTSSSRTSRAPRSQSSWSTGSNGGARAQQLHAADELGVDLQEGHGQGLEPGDQGADRRRGLGAELAARHPRTRSTGSGNHGTEENFTVDHPIWSKEEAAALAEGSARRAVAQYITGEAEVTGSPIFDLGKAGQDHRERRWRRPIRSTASTTSWASPTGSRTQGDGRRLRDDPAPRARRAEGLAMRPADHASSRWMPCSTGCTTRWSVRTRIRTTSIASRFACRGSTTATQIRPTGRSCSPRWRASKFGWYTLPDIDDVVVVMFIAGDISQPVILGGVWSKPDFSPEPNEDGKNNFRGYRSRSGHRLILDDSEQGEGRVRRQDRRRTCSASASSTRMAPAPTSARSTSRRCRATTGVSFSTMEGKLEITCKDGKLTVTAGKNIKINAKTTIDIKAGGDLKMEGTTPS